MGASTYSRMSQILEPLPGLDPRFQRELGEIAGEPDAELRRAQYLHLAGRLEKAGNGDAALSLYRQFGAKERLDAIVGRGRFGARFEYLLGRFASEATSYKSILPMMAGTMAFQVGKAAALSYLSSPRGGARLLATLAGMSLEVPVFTFGAKSLQAWSGDSVSWGLSSNGRELAATALTLGFLKVSGFASQAALRIPNFAASRMVRSVLSPAAMFAGLLGAHHLETELGLRPRIEGATIYVDTLASLLSLSVGARIGNHLFEPLASGWRGLQVRRASRDSPSRAPFWATASLFTCLAGCSVGGESASSKGLLPIALGLGGLAMVRGGRKPGTRIRSDTIEDPKLLELSDSSLALRDTNSEHPQIAANTRRWGERLQEMGDIRGDWMLAQLDRRPVAQDLQAKIQADILENFGIEAGYHLELGGKSLVLTLKDTPELSADSLREFLRAGYAFPATRLRIMESSFGDKRISGPLRVAEKLGPFGLSKYGKYLDKLASLDRRQIRWLRDMDFLIGGHHSIAEILRSLADSPTLAKLSDLDLAENLVGDAGLRYLAQSPNLDNVRYLELGNTGVGDAGIQALAESKGLAGLRELPLAQNRIGDAGAIALAQSLTRGQLRDVDFYDNQIGLAGARAIADSQAFPNLRLLHMSQNAFGRAGVLAILDSKNFPNLRYLDLGENGFSEVEMKALIPWQNFPNLESLDLAKRDPDFD